MKELNIFQVPTSVSESLESPWKGKYISKPKKKKYIMLQGTTSSYAAAG